MYRANRSLLYVPKLNSTSTSYFHNKHIFFCLFINIQSHRYLLPWCIFSLKKKTVQSKQTAKIAEAKELKIRIRGGWGEKRRQRNHWFERTLTCVHHHIIHSLFRSITFTQTLLNSKSKHFVVFGVEQQFNAFTKTPDKYAHMLKPSSVKCVCLCVSCMHLFTILSIYTICYVLKRLGYCRESLFRTNYTECCYWILSWAEPCWAELIWAYHRQ